MIQERAEEYLGAVYRLRIDSTTPVSISELGDYFGFSPVSVHEMVRKLVQQGCVEYHPYHGVTLTPDGEHVALALLRRHRLWERFLTDMLHIPWERAHDIAGDLEHAAPDLVTERLADLLGNPQSCPHGAPIPPDAEPPSDLCLASLPEGASGRVTRISPETFDLLHHVKAWGGLPGCRLTVVAQNGVATLVTVDAGEVSVPAEEAQAVWVEVI